MKQPHCKWPGCGKFVKDDPPHLCDYHGTLMLAVLQGAAIVRAFHFLSHEHTADCFATADGMKVCGY